ncbi:sigma-54 dependent transcriptional regulator [Rapidithrix thailandica]|uniref:Sigma-54 dependent transcriptional regulator n=1 Tax=Rapidithrix thailandica TaxID=413964 RepID=A0AAW9SK69_9BACT
MLQGKILVIDDDVDVLDAAKLYLKRHLAKVDTETDPQVLPDLLHNESYDVILLDMNFTKDVSSGKEGFYWLDQILKLDPSAVVVLITAYGDVELAVKAIKEGATDFVVKPWENKKLLATVLSSMKLRASRLESEKLRSWQKQVSADMDYHYQAIIGQSAPMLQLYETIRQVARTDANVLILGENGTGKELIARAIHRNSQRSEAVFVNVDLGALSENLFESELFGHVKGAFTDAKEDRPGRFEIASGGSIFLDEIGNLSISMQAKLLSVLQSKNVVRVGSNKTIPVDVRQIFATNMDLYQMVKEKSFRQDLLYRINTIEIHVPPLRERVEDIPLLAEYFLQQYVKKYQKNIRSLSEPALKRMQKYPWPGNVRELQHVMERAVIMNKGYTLQAEDLFINVRQTYEAEGQDKESVVISNFNLEHVEKIMIQKILRKYHGSVTQAARELGLTRTSLYRRMEKYDL